MHRRRLLHGDDFNDINFTVEFFIFYGLPSVSLICRAQHMALQWILNPFTIPRLKPEKRT
jgi:hypothetical protein